MDKEEIARLYDQTRHLAHLVDDLRELAQAEARQLPLNIGEFSINRWFKDETAIFSQQLKKKVLSLRSCPLPRISP